MKLPSLLAVALLPFGLLAAPTAEAADLEIRQEAVARAAGAGLFERDRTCRLEGDAKSVNCRAGPGTKYKVVTTLGMWSEWVFDCVKSGECVNIGGKVNCGWHFIKYLGDHGCYINGHYTSDACTQDGGEDKVQRYEAAWASVRTSKWDKRLVVLGLEAE